MCSLPLMFLGPTPRGRLFFFHVTAACSFLSTSLAAVVGMYVAHACFCSRGGGWGRVTNNVPDDFKTVGHKGPCNFLFLLLLLLTC